MVYYISWLYKVKSLALHGLMSKEPMEYFTFISLCTSAVEIFLKSARSYTNNLIGTLYLRCMAHMPEISAINRLHFSGSSRFLSDRSQSCVGQLDPIVRRRGSLFGHVARGHACPPSVAVPHRSVTRSLSRPELEAMSRPPSEQVMVWALTNSTGTTVHLLLTLETSRHSWTLGGDATVLDDYALTTTTTTSFWYVCHANLAPDSSDTRFRRRL